MKKNILKGLLCLAVISVNSVFVCGQIYLPSTAGTTTNTPTGNVGIGNATPLQKLHVSGNILTNGLLMASDGYNSGYYSNVGSDEKRIISGYASGWFMNVGPYPNGNGSVSLRMADKGVAGSTLNWTYPFIVENNGRVVIGSKTLPTSISPVAAQCASVKLFVAGTIGAEEVKVSLTNWCDYVFDQGYKLKSLKEIENYIQANKHLPEVPSEKEVVENGVAIGEMMKIHMKKIEELTLYMIELQKQNEKLAAEVASLKK